MEDRSDVDMRASDRWPSAACVSLEAGMDANLYSHPVLACHCDKAAAKGKNRLRLSRGNAMTRPTPSAAT